MVKKNLNLANNLTDIKKRGRKVFPKKNTDEVLIEK